MASFSEIQKKVGGKVCRRCINQLYQVRLFQSDCWYANPYPMRCDCCGEMRSIVSGLRLSGQLKLLLK